MKHRLCLALSLLAATPACSVEPPPSQAANLSEFGPDDGTQEAPLWQQACDVYDTGALTCTDANQLAYDEDASSLEEAWTCVEGPNVGCCMTRKNTQSSWSQIDVSFTGCQLLDRCRDVESGVGEEGDIFERQGTVFFLIRC